MQNYSCINYTKTWNNNTLLNDQWVTEGIRKF
jgi:hypothetical protein